MKRKMYLFVFTCLLGLLSITGSAQDQLANWNFDYEYATSSSGGITYYTPTGTAFSANPNITMYNSSFSVYPNSQVGTVTDYSFNAITQYCQLYTGYNNYTARLYFTGPNTVSDFSNASEHTNYFQFSFPTKGYDEIALHFSMASGQNNVNDYLEVVYSTDGGTTWVDAGSSHALSGWWLYQAYDVSISARDKDNVLVRMIACTTSASGGRTFYLDYFNVTGTVYSGPEVVNTSGTITWPFNLGTSGQVATYSGSTSDYFNQDYVSNGSNLTYNSARTTYGITYTCLKPTTQVNTPDVNNMVGFNISPKTGLGFTPTAISFDCQRYGTDGGFLDVIWKSADGTSTILQTGLKPARDNSGSGTHATYNLSSLSIPASNGVCTLELYVYNLGNTKLLGLANVVVEGTIQGTLGGVTTYTLATSVSPDGAGSVVSNPVGNEFDEGTEVTLTANRNFGYSFSHWENDAGETVSTDNPYSFTLNQNISLKAVFVPLNTYSLTVNVDGGAKDYMVTVSPAGTMAGNLQMYEEGTNVTLSASNNPILSFVNWGSGETTPDLVVVMDADQNISANYTPVEYMVGWDFYVTGNNARVADFYSAANNETSVLILRKADGTTAGWLDKSQLAAGGYEGKPAAVNWKQIADNYYYQTSFNASGFKDIQVTASMLYNYNAYSVQQCEYSLDGVNFIPVGNITMTSPKVWYKGAFTLPADANFADLVYVRWIPDYTSNIVGHSPGNDGTAISEIYVTGTIADEQVSQVITFDELPGKTYGDQEFGLTGTASSGLPVSFASSDTTVAKIVDGMVYLTGAGHAVITASQAGDDTYLAASDVSQELTVEKGKANLTMLETTVIYDGTIKSVSYLTDPEGLPVRFYYYLDGYLTHPIGIGTYQVMGNIQNDRNYKGYGFGTLVIIEDTVEVQTISFDALLPKHVLDADFAPGATASSGLDVTYTSSDPTVATIIGGEVHIVGAGTTTITALQAGNGYYYAAENVEQTLLVEKNTQTITFNELPLKNYMDPDFELEASSSSGLAVSYKSSDENIATIVNGGVHIVGPGQATITASQAGNSTYKPAGDVMQILTIEQAEQSITFSKIEQKTFGNPDFLLDALASSGLAVSFTSSDGTVATVVDGIVHIAGAGTTTITALQTGNSRFKPASQVVQILIVEKASQSITFGEITTKNYGDPDFGLNASASSGLKINYLSSDVNVATIVDGFVHITGAGTTIITAHQDGDNNFNAATPAEQELKVDFRTAINNLSGATVKVYPNPAHKYLKVEVGESLAKGAEIVLTDLSGKTVVNKVMPSRMIELNVQSMNPGMYILSVSSNGNVVHFKVVIK